MRSVRTLVLALLLAATALAPAQGMGDAAATASVTIENGSPQAISPPVVIVHADGYAPFEVGAAAPAELVPLVEDGDASELAVVARVAQGVQAVVVAEGPLPPGETVTLEVPVAADTPFLTVLGMLVSSNDAVVRVYDAGSERDTEACAHIPGPPCGSPGARVTDGAEGHVTLDGGILGVGDLDPAEWDWRDPVLGVRIALKNGSGATAPTPAAQEISSPSAARSAPGARAHSRSGRASCAAARRVA